MKDYFSDSSESYYWFEQSVKLYQKINSALNEDFKITEILMETDIQLIELWHKFQEESMSEVKKIMKGTIQSVRIPLMFGYSSKVYYYKGIIITRINKENVK